MRALRARDTGARAAAEEEAEEEGVKDPARGRVTLYLSPREVAVLYRTTKNLAALHGPDRNAHLRARRKLRVAMSTAVKP